MDNKENEATQDNTEVSQHDEHKHNANGARQSTDSENAEIKTPHPKRVKFSETSFKHHAVMIPEYFDQNQVELSLPLESLENTDQDFKEIGSPHPKRVRFNQTVVMPQYINPNQVEMRSPQQSFQNTGQGLTEMTSPHGKWVRLSRPTLGSQNAMVPQPYYINPDLVEVRSPRTGTVRTYVNHELVALRPSEFGMIPPQTMTILPQNGIPPQSAYQGEPQMHHNARTRSKTMVTEIFPALQQPQSQLDGPRIVPKMVKTEATGVAKPDTQRGWSTGLFSCFGDSILCCLGGLCPCILAMTVSCSMNECCCVGNTYPVALRTILRTEHNIEGSICEDTCVMVFCCPCGLCQIAREIDTVNAEK